MNETFAYNWSCMTACNEEIKMGTQSVERDRFTTCRRWDYSEVIVDRDLLRKRIQLIQAAARIDPAVQWQEFSEDGVSVTQWVERVPALGEPAGSRLLASLELLAERLDFLAIGNVVHGDIKRANLVWDGLRWVLIDWEPVLVWHTTGGQTAFRVTRPYLHPDDFHRKTVSQYTDKTGFYFFARTMLNGWQKITSTELRSVHNEAKGRSFTDILRKASMVADSR